MEKYIPFYCFDDFCAWYRRNCNCCAFSGCLFCAELQNLLTSTSISMNTAMQTGLAAGIETCLMFKPLTINH